MLNTSQICHYLCAENGEIYLYAWTLLGEIENLRLNEFPNIWNGLFRYLRPLLRILEGLGREVHRGEGWLLCSNMPRLIWCLFQYNDRIDWSNFIGWELFHAADGQNIVNIQYIVLKEMMISTLQAVICMGHKAWAYLIFVNSINSDASVNKLTEKIFSQLTRKGLRTQCVISQRMCNFAHSVSFHSQCVIWLTVCNFPQSVILLTVWNFTDIV